MGIGRYAVPENFANWKAHIKELSRRPNVMMKLGGMSTRRCGFDFENYPRPRTSRDLAAAWGPYVETCIELFGTGRCMFESNFPPDKAGGSYRNVWNAFKLIAADYSDDEKARLFSENAKAVYRLEGV